MKKRLSIVLSIIALLIGNVDLVYGANNIKNVSSNVSEENMLVPLDEFVERYNSVLSYVNSVFFDTDIDEWNIFQIRKYDYTFQMNEVMVMLNVDEEENVEEIMLGIDSDSKNPKNFSATVVSSIYALDKALSEGKDLGHGADAAFYLTADIMDQLELEQDGFSYKIVFSSEMCAFDMKWQDDVNNSSDGMDDYVVQMYKQINDIFGETVPTIEQCYVGEFRSANSYENKAKTNSSEEGDKNNDIVYVYVEADGEEYYFTYSDNKELQGHMSGTDLEKLDASAEIPQYEKELLGMKLQADYSKMTGWDGWTEYTDSDIKDLTE